MDEQTNIRITAVRAAYNDALSVVQSAPLSGRKADRDKMIAAIERKRDGLIKLLEDISAETNT